MNKLARNLLTLMLVGSVIVVYGCDKDKDGGPTRPPAENWRNLVVTLQNMDSHLGQLIAFRVVSRYDELVSVWDELRCVVRIDSLDQTPFTFTMPLAVPEGLHRLDFWCDDVVNGWFDPYDVDFPDRLIDHSYRIYMPETGTATVTLIHPDAAQDTIGAYFDSVPDSAWFLDINQPTWMRPPAHFWMTFTQMDTAMGHALELQVVDPTITGGRTVGYFRKSNVVADSFLIVLPSIGELDATGAAGKVFQVDFYVDMDDSGAYDAADFAWTVMCTTGTYLDTIGVNTIQTHADSLMKKFTFNTNFATGFVWP